MKSMTGYGRACAEKNGRMITIEVRGVNHRYLDCTVKAPRQYGFLEEVLKKAATTRIARGKVEIYVSIEARTENEVTVRVNTALAGRYLTALRELGNLYGLEDDITVMSLVKMADILSPERVEPNMEQLSADVCEVFYSACDGFNEMRVREGLRMAEDIYTRCARIEGMIGEIEKRSPERVQKYRERLLVRMREVLADTNIDETRILTEAALYADKTAVDEETVRLRSHLHQMDQMLRDTQPIGRKLDFLVQELNREANTIGSKANDVEMAHLVVTLKSEIEKIREQVQNIE